MLVSHDRYLIDALATQVWEVMPAARALNVFKGTYSEYRALKQSSQHTSPPQTVEHKVVLSGKLSKEKSGVSKGEQQKLKRKVQELENNISTLEKRIKEIEGQLDAVPVDPARVQKLGSEYMHFKQSWKGLF